MISDSLPVTLVATEPPFSPDNILGGIEASSTCADGPGQVCVELGGIKDCLRFYNAGATFRTSNPIVLLAGDVTRRQFHTSWEVLPFYTRWTAAVLQGEVEQLAATTCRAFVHLARPGVFGSTGNHQHRRREREVALVDGALRRLKRYFAWNRIDLMGQSGGGHLVAALMARRSDIGCAVIASGNVAVRKRLQELGMDRDITGYTDYVDPIDLVGDVAVRSPDRVVMLTDPEDRLVSAAVQTEYCHALRHVGVAVEQRFVSAPDPGHHNLRQAGILAVASCITTREESRHGNAC